MSSRFSKKLIVVWGSCYGRGGRPLENGSGVHCPHFEMTVRIPEIKQMHCLLRLEVDCSSLFSEIYNAIPANLLLTYQRDEKVSCLYGCMLNSIQNNKQKRASAGHPMCFGQRLLYNCNAFLKLLYCPDLSNSRFRSHYSESGFGSHKAENPFPARPVSYTQEYHL